MKLEIHKGNYDDKLIFRRLQPKIKKSYQKENDLEFQIMDWYTYDHDENDSESEEDEYDSDDEPIKKEVVDNKKYIIQLFGITKNGESVSCKIKEFNTYFYFLFPQEWKKNKLGDFIEYLKKKVYYKFKNSIVNYKIVRRKKFRGFTNNEEFKFCKLYFNNKEAMNTYKRSLDKIHNKKERISGLGTLDVEVWDFIDPMLRFIHERNLNAAGWVKIPKNGYQLITRENDKETYCQIEAECKCDNIELLEREEVAPIIQASYDIEADSSHGDFPLAVKDYRKLYIDIINYLVGSERQMKKLETQISLERDKTKKDELKEKYQSIDKKLKDPELFERLIHLAFREDPNEKNEDDIHFIYNKINKKTKLPQKPKEKDIKHVCNKLREKKYFKEIMEIRKIKNARIIKAEDYFTKDIDDDDIDEEDKKFNKQIEKYSNKIVKIFNKNFPPIEGDKVIQIGTTVQKYGDQNCYLKHIICLEGVNPIENAYVETYDTEEEVLLAWTRFIIDLDPDIITGYNIFGFDFKYMYNRAQELGIIDKFSLLSRAKDLQCDLVENKLSSSALGDNFLYFIGHLNYKKDDTEIDESFIDEDDEKGKKEKKEENKNGVPMRGRVFIDLQKAIQGDPTKKLESYSLDSVASHFMRGKIKNFENKDNNTLLYCDKVSGLKPLNYITISVNDGIKTEKFQGGKKLRMINIDYENKTLLLENSIELTDMKNTKYEWCENKDDVSAKDIFRLQKESDMGRTTIARYCIQDCELVNRIMTKLDIVTNAIGMANVCGVPLGYLFLRGQGIKILSLVAKECRKEKFLLPILPKPSNDPEKKEGYEGAIVLTPYPNIYYETVVVCDYNSLYPSSMISHNLSHDSFVMDKKYDNIPGYEYWTVEYDNYMYVRKGKAFEKVINKDEPKKYCRYVQPKKDENGNIIDETRGIIPKILMKLLFARKATRGRMKYSIVKTKDGRTLEGIYSEKDDIVELEYFIVNELRKAKHKIQKNEIDTITKKYNEFQVGILDGLQLAYKVTANSLYGQVGASTSPIYLKDIAASTTAVGRHNLIFAKEYSEENYPGCKAVYGDSVMPYTPIMLKDNDKIFRCTIEKLYNKSYNKKPYEEFKPFDTNRTNKEQSNCDYYTMTSSGWSKIVRIIRHKTIKNIYEVKTKNSWVHITEDHSLLDKNKKKIKPLDLKIGETELLSINGSEVVINIEKIFENYTDYVYDIETEDGTFQAGIGNLIVKNTDSVFLRFDCRYPKGHEREGEKMKGLDQIYESIRLCIEASAEISKRLPRPHNLEFEKAIYPFILLSKKRYVGNYYTDYNDSFYTNSMGIVLKRRDNAPIVKHIYGGVVNIILKHHLSDEFKKVLADNPDLDIKDYMVKKADKWVQEEVQRLLDGKFTMDKFIITKSLKAEYKNEDTIAHKVLANRMGDRDPGNKPQSNDRIPYAFVQTKEPKKGEKILQGDRIENPQYIIDNNLKLDYKVYLEKQVEVPVSQLFGLVVEHLNKYVKNKYHFAQPDVDKLASFDRTTEIPGVNTIQREAIRKEIRKVQKKRDEQRTKAASSILFEQKKAFYDNERKGIKKITDFF